MNKAIVGLFVLFGLIASSFVIANDENSESYKLFKSNTYVKNPLDLRDPFKRRINKKKTNIDRKFNESGFYSNQPNIMSIKTLEEIKVIGIVIGPERRAMLKKFGSEGSDTLFIKEGMFIGENNAEVKAILPGGIVLVEKIRNVYDQDEYLETVIPVSED